MAGAARNPEGVWVNVEPFREAAAHYLKHGFYCGDAEGTPRWFDYWREQRRRCMEGYAAGGVKITGDHYFYLNFTPISRVEDASVRSSRKVVGFPDFWDGDYNYFWARNIARFGALRAVLGAAGCEALADAGEARRLEEAVRQLRGLQLMVGIRPENLGGGYNLIVGKSRRKGYSYKNAAIAANNYFTRPNSLTIIDAYDKKYLYPNGAYSKVTDVISFVNGNTAWSMPTDRVNKANHIRSSYYVYRDGVQLEQGFKSEVMAVSCNDDPDANRGQDAVDIFIEEAGAFGSPGLLKQLYAASEDCVKAGDIKTGMITIYGTSGDMLGGTADYADMHSRPLAFGFLPFDNVWDEELRGTQCGFFHPCSWNMEGFYDRNGNSDVAGAAAHVLRERKRLMQNMATSTEVQKRIQENPLTPAEAFSLVSCSSFPVVELKRQLAAVIANGWQESRGTPVAFSREGGVVRATPILDGSASPITTLSWTDTSARGCPVVYEYPIAGAPRGLYKIGYDPVRQDSGTSLAAIIVYKGTLQGSQTRDCIVAEYVGRGALSEDADVMAEFFADFYNTQVMYENEVIGTKNYFRRIRRMHLLASQPDAVIGKNIKGSRVSRVYGCHMNGSLKDAGERYVRDWLSSVMDYDEDGNPVRAIDRIYSRRLLEELIDYRRGGNYDLVSALFMCMFQVQEQLEGYAYGDGTPARRNAKRLLDMIDKMYRR